MMMLLRCCRNRRTGSRRALSLATGVAALCCLLMPTVGRGFAAKRSQAAPKPIATISVTPLGYRPPGEIYLLSRLASVSVDFIDNGHLLFTFHESRLMHRDEMGHDDQFIRAVVLDIASGKVEKAADWRLHDRLRYLLPVGDGTFLVRQGNRLMKTDRTLELRPFMSFRQRLFEMQLSPSGQTLVTEADLERHSEETHQRLVNQALLNGDPMPDEDVQVEMIRVADQSVIAVAKADNPVKLAITSNGYVIHDQNKAGEMPQRAGDMWKISYVPFVGEKKQIVTVQSVCTPTEMFLDEDTLMVTTCKEHTADRVGRAISLSGKELWTGSWDSRLVWPNFYLSPGGKAFAIGWLSVSHPVDSFDPVNDSDVQAQLVQVLSTATGHLLMTAVASPVYSGGQNFALSADGTRFAVISNGAIEVYEVPADVPQ